MQPGPGHVAPESYGRVLGNLLGVVLALGGIAAVMFAGRPTPPEPKPGAVVASSPVRQDKVQAKKVRTPKPPQVIAPAPTPEPPRVDTEAVARAEAELAAASQARARAEARALGSSKRLEDASAQAGLDAKVAQELALRVKEPSARVDEAAARGGFLKAETDKLKGELATYAQAPRPKAKVLSNKNPVARPAENSEHHFEVRRNRVAYIELDKLVGLVKRDVELRIRLADGARLIESKVGPVGPFSLQYEFRKSLPARLEDFVERRAITYRPSGWEIVPEFEARGESFELTRTPVSEFARVIHRLTPGKVTITLWVYPDSFELYRKLRDDLQSRGYLVAGRPLPEGMAIRGGPGGSVSAGQ